MSKEIISHSGKEFKDFDYSGQAISAREFYNCRFINCNFGKSDFREVYFEECVFIDSDLSMANICDVGFRNVIFEGCKILGLDFSVCNKLAALFSFKSCMMDYCSFISMKLKKIHFKDCSMKEVDFTFADLSLSIFDCCALDRAVFQNSVLENSDFRTAVNFTIDVDSNRMRGAKFLSTQLEALLSRYQLDIS